MALDTPDPKATAESTKAMADLGNALDASIKKVQKLVDVQARLKEGKISAKEATDAIEKLGKATEKATKQTVDFSDVWSEKIKGMTDDLDELIETTKIMPFKKQFDSKNIVDMVKRVNALKKELAATFKTKGPIDEKKVARIDTRIKKLTEDIAASKHELDAMADVKDIAAGFKSIGGLWRAFSTKSPKGLRDASYEAGRVGDKLKASGEDALGMAGLGKKISGMLLKTLGGVFSSLATMLSSPAGWIAIAIKGIWDMGMAADEFVKNANKRFAQVRGPDIMTTDVKGQFRKFNDLIFDMGKNLRVGLNADQVMEFVQSITQAGVHLDKLNTGFSNYRDAVYVAAKASKTLGVELPLVGNMMGTMINELRMNMQNVDKSFVEMGFDAQKAGISTDKFWGAIENATASLGFYGIGIEGVSKTMASFSKTGAMGIKETSDSVANLTQTFSKMSEEHRAALIQLAGPDIFVDMGKKMEKEWRSKAGTLKTQINVLLEKRKTTEKGSPEEVEINNNLDKLQDQFANANRMISMGAKAQTGSAVDMATMLPYMSGTEQATTLLTALMKKTGVKSWKDLLGVNQILLEKVEENLGIPSDLVRQLTAQATDISDKMEDSLGILEDGVSSDDSFLKQLSDIADPVSDIPAVGKDMSALIDLTKAAEPDQEKIAKASESLVKTMVDSGRFSEDAAKNVAKSLILDKTTDKKFAKLVMEQVTANKKQKKSLPEMIKILRAGYKAAGIDNEGLIESGNLTTESIGGLQDRAEATFKQAVKQTLSFKEMQAIAADQGKWSLYSMGFLQGINKGVFDIFQFLIRDNADYMTDNQKADKEQLEATTGMQMTVENQRGLMLKSLEEQSKLKTAIQGQTDANEDIKKILAQQDPAARTKEMTGAIGAVNKKIEELKKKDQSDPKVHDSLASLNTHLSLLTKLQSSDLPTAESTTKTINAIVGLGDVLDKGFERSSAVASGSVDEQIKALEGLKTLAPDSGDTVDALTALLKQAKRGKLTPDQKRTYREQTAKLSGIMTSQGKTLPGIQTAAETQTTKLNEQLTKTDDTIDKLKDLNKTNADIEDIQSMLLEATPGGLDIIADRLKKSMEEDKKTYDEAAKYYHVSADQAERIYKKSASLQEFGKKTAWTGRPGRMTIPQQIEAYKAEQKTASGAAPAPAPAAAPGKSEPAAKQFMNTPEIVTGTGLFKLHAGETMLPKDYPLLSSKDTTPLMPPAATPAPAAAGGAGGGNNIQISVTATERDLAQRIANEVRGVLYQQQLTGRWGS